MKLSSTDPKLVSRRDKVFSQSLITAIASFSTQLRCAIGGTFNNMKVNKIAAFISSVSESILVEVYKTTKNIAHPFR